MDLMSEVIGMVRIGSPGSRLIRQANSEGVRFPAFEGSGFHIVLRGACWLISEFDEPVALAPGDVVLASSGAQHGLNHVPCTLDELPPAVMAPLPPAPGPFDFEFLCGAYRLERGRAPQYLHALPDLIAVSPDYTRHPGMRALIDLLLAETTGARPGSGATLRSLLDLILIHVLRQWHDRHGPDDWPATGDPAIAAALRQIHEHPQRPWTVSGLSATAGLPRTAFTRRFSAVVGQPPMRYLTGWRLNRGAQLLRESDAPLAAIARQVGYSTEFAFSTAFRREHGVSPSRFRQDPEVVRIIDLAAAR